MRRLALALAIVLWGGRAEAAGPPGLTLARGVLTLSRLPVVLGDDAVAPHLQTGLTTVFLFTVEGRATPAQKGAAQVAVRYDLWDEVYRVELSPGLDGHRAFSAASVAATGGSNASLVEWWRTAALRIAPGAGSWQAPLGRMKVTLQALPFSQAEQRDAQDWLLRSFRTEPLPGVAGGTGPRAGPAAQAPVRDFYGAMLASSIGLRTLTSWSWNVDVVQVPAR
jgi:hypothetical protein